MSYNKSKMYSHIAKSVFNDHLGSNNEPCYNQNGVVSNRVIKLLRTYRFSHGTDLEV